MPNEFALMLVQYVCLLFCLSVHEAAHAAMANRCGDPTGRLLGRVTLNPLAHIDLIGTVIMPLLIMYYRIPFLFGWAKPVPFNPRNLKNIRRDPVFIALAGPASNLLMALFFVFVARIVVMMHDWGALPSVPGLVIGLLLSMIGINLVLAAFNIIPVPPLDGHHVLYYFLPASGQRVLEQIGPFGIIIAIAISKPLFRYLDPLFDMIYRFAFSV